MTFDEPTPRTSHAPKPNLYLDTPHKGLLESGFCASFSHVVLVDPQRCGDYRAAVLRCFEQMLVLVNVRWSGRISNAIKRRTVPKSRRRRFLISGIHGSLQGTCGVY
jgi:hypothetical protein